MNYTIPELDDRFSALLKEFQEHHQKQNDHLDYYDRSVVYPAESGDVLDTRPMTANLLRVFADKNIQYTAKFPVFKRPYKDPNKNARAVASIIERAVFATWRQNKGALRQKEWAIDATLMTEAVAVTEPIISDPSTGMLLGVSIERYDPRFCYWEYADSNGDDVEAFYAAKPMTKSEIKRRWGVEPTYSNINDDSMYPTDGNSAVGVDSRERFFVVWRWDRQKKCCWVGDQWVEKPHDHGLPFIPVDRCVPFPNPTDPNRFGNFFLNPLLKVQAEYNKVLNQKARYTRKMGNPMLWVRGMIGTKLKQEIDRMQSGSGGALSFKQAGEAGYLNPPETKVFDDYLDHLRNLMGDLANMPPAVFGLSQGANTSGDAIQMRFQPVTQSAELQNVSWADWYRSINRKMLWIYQNMGQPKQEFRFDNVVFMPEMIEAYYETEVFAPEATPKDDLAVKKFWMEAVINGVAPRVTAYEAMGLLDPEDTLELLADEMSDPRIHADKFQMLMQGIASDPMNSANQPGKPAGKVPPTKVA